MSIESDFNYAIKMNLEELRKKLVVQLNNNVISDLLYDNLMINIKNCLSLINNKEKILC